jgi:hypothetical protein
VLLYKQCKQPSAAGTKQSKGLPSAVPAGLVREAYLAYRKLKHTVNKMLSLRDNWDVTFSTSDISFGNFLLIVAKYEKYEEKERFLGVAHQKNYCQNKKYFAISS